jgi:type II secretory pathway pseudopilin PulG
MTTPAMQRPMLKIKNHIVKPGAFSLIEVTLSIGIIAFALLTVVALLPVGLQTNKNTVDQARATQAMNSIVLAIQDAIPYNVTSSTTKTYKAAQPFGQSPTSAYILSWSVTNSTQGAKGYNVYLDENGIPISPTPTTIAARVNAAMLAYVSLTPPPNLTSAGKAYIGVTWDKTVITTASGWTGALGTVAGQKNYVETTIYFAPK